MQERGRNVLEEPTKNGRAQVLNAAAPALEEAHKAIFEKSEEAIFILHSVSGEILDANGNAADLTGYPVSKLRGMHLKRFFRANEINDNSFLSNEKSTLKTCCQRNGDDTVFVEMKIACVRRRRQTLKLVFVRKLERINAPLLVRPPSFTPQRTESSSARTASPQDHEFPNIIGRSVKIRETCQRIGQVAKTDCTVLIQGESGAGKEIVAQAIHCHSLRSKGPFVKVNCAALSETLLESELFGHVKGAFTGAIRDRSGRFQQADGGTILLDEINSMTFAGQAKFLRVLEDREFQRVGSSRVVSADIRIVVASNVDLGQAVATSEFREDLYYRLNVFPICVAPLREKKEDVPLLARHFLKKYNLAIGKEIQGFAPETLALMVQHDWPGNIRELKNAVEYAVIVSRSDLILPSELPLNLTSGDHPEKNIHLPEEFGLREKLNLLEKEIIIDALKRANGVKKSAADMLQIDPRNFPYLLKKHDLVHG